MAEKITMNADGVLNVPDNPIIPFIEGDGIGVDIWPAAKLVLDAGAKKYGKTIEWKEVLAGEKAFNETGDWLPEADGDRISRLLDRHQGSAHHAHRAEDSGPSTWRFARSSTSTCVCDRCAGSRACPHRSSTLNSWTW